jgi:hypothetical protein
MYTQRHTMPDGASIPKNYSGNAFRYPPIGSLANQEAEPPTSPMADEAREKDLGEISCPIALGEHPREESARLGAFSLLGGLGLGHEELLLLGLCLLLSSDGGSLFSRTAHVGDVLPYLLLLLFLG